MAESEDVGEVSNGPPSTYFSNLTQQTDDVLNELVQGDLCESGLEDSISSSFEGIGYVNKARRSSILSRNGSVAGRPKVKKSVSFCSMPENRRVSNAKDCLLLMQQGTELTKLKANGRIYRRYYWLEDNLSEIRWMPTSKKYNKAKILVDQIKEVQSGKNAEALKNKEIEAFYQEECILSILSGSNYVSLDLVAKSPDEANIWIAGLNYLIAMRDKSKKCDISDNNVGDGIEKKRSCRDRWLQEAYSEQAGTADDLLSEKETIDLILKLNPAVDTQYIYLKLKELYSSDRDRSKGVLTCQEFVTLYKDVASRQEIYFLMTKYGSSDEHMTADDLLLFLETEQGMSHITKKECEDLINKYEPSREARAKQKLGIDGLLSYLLSNDCDVFNQNYKTVAQDMTQPLSSYFINSSHKTYLLEDQLKGPSSVAAYTRALKHGCRYIEVDCWDGPSEPVVYHGRTLTSKIRFNDVLDVIQKYAFHVTPYPLILSIENHCSIEQQKIIVLSLRTKLGEFLESSPVDYNASTLPSPEQLKYKILLKCKKLDFTLQNPVYGEVSDEDESLDADWRRTSNKKDNSRRQPLLKELSSMITWCQSESYDKYTQHTRKLWHFLSVSDLYAQKLIQSDFEEFLAMNRLGLTRVYPNCSRVDSSNFNPQDMWNYGCQIVALNQQSQGVCYDLNVAKFKQNGSCGFVLKPALMRDASACFNPQSVAHQSLPGVTPQLMQVKVISGYKFPKPKGSGTKSLITDPYVLIEIFGVPADCCSVRTKTVPGNGQNPFFDESFTFYFHFPEMAMIRFNILDDDYIGDEFIAQYTIPFNCVKTGFRHINLLSSSGEKIPGCTLFVHITSCDAFDKKPIRRGTTSSSKLRIDKNPIVIKPVGVKSIDDLAKCLHSTLNELAELRHNVESALVKFKEACDVSSVSNIKYCIRTIGNRVSSAKGLNIRLVNNMDMPMFVVSEGNPPDILKKALQAYLTWCKEWRTLKEQGETKKGSVLEMEKMLGALKSELCSNMDENLLSEKKLQKVRDSFDWNLRILKDQMKLYDNYVECCQAHFTKVIEAAIAAGIEFMSESVPSM